MIGSLLAFRLMPLRMLGPDGWKVAAALTARHIGGSVNYVAVRTGGGGWGWGVVVGSSREVQAPKGCQSSALLQLRGSVNGALPPPLTPPLPSPRLLSARCRRRWLCRPAHAWQAWLLMTLL